MRDSERGGGIDLDARVGAGVLRVGEGMGIDAGVGGDGFRAEGIDLDVRIGAGR